MNNSNLPTMILDGFSRIFDCLLLGLVWAICCIPVITIGASCTAVYYAYNKVLRQEEGHLLKEFFRCFKENFKQSTIAWLIVAVVGAFLYGDISIVAAFMETIPLSGALFAFAVTLFVVLLAWAVYVFPYIARFELDTKTILKNSFIIMGINAGWSVLLVALTLVVIFLSILVPFVCFAFVAVYIPTVNMILEHVFSKYME